MLLPWGLNFIMMMALLTIKPHNRKILNFNETLGEICFFGIHSLILLFAINESSDFLSFNSKLIMGFCCIGFILVAFLVQFIILMRENFDTIKLIIKKFIVKITSKTNQYDKGNSKDIKRKEVLNIKINPIKKRSIKRKITKHKII